MVSNKLPSKALRREFVRERTAWFAFDVATLLTNLPKADPLDMKTPAIPEHLWYRHQVIIRNIIEEFLLSLYPSPILDIIADLNSDEKKEGVTELSNRLAINYKRMIKLCGGEWPSDDSFIDMIRVTSKSFFEERWGK